MNLAVGDRIEVVHIANAVTSDWDFLLGRVGTIREIVHVGESAYKVRLDGEDEGDNFHVFFTGEIRKLSLLELIAEAAV